MVQSPACTKDLQPDSYYPSQTWYKYIYTSLQHSIHNPQECRAITNQLLAHHLGYSSTGYVLNTLLKASEQTLQKLHTALQRLRKQEPLQYILGYAPFLDYTFKVTKGVFIPRSETEEMVHDIIQQQYPAKSILDIGTGSGCIAICLKKAYIQAGVDALDVSTTALQMAYENAQVLGATINWLKLDLLHDPLPAKKWDLIVSNPPYIPLVEKKHLNPNTFHYEPHQALFVPNQNPLIFYKRIAALTRHHLTPTGFLYVEIHEALGGLTAQLFQDAGFKKVHIHKDLHGKDRWIACQK